MIALAAVLYAAAAQPVISVAGGWDSPTEQPWAGAELALHPDNTRGVAGIGRMAPAWGFADGRPLMFIEGGIAFVVPEDEALVRAGILVRPVLSWADYPLPIGTAAGERFFGVIPGAMALLEMEWNPAAPITVGIKAGAGASATTADCPIGVTDASQTRDCLGWYAGAIGGFYARKRWQSGLATELVVGTTASASLGFAF